MPRYLRWIASITTGLIAQIVFQIAVLAAFVGTDRTEVGGGTAAVVTFGATIVNVLVCLAINDWLAARYPVDKKAASET